MTIKTKISDTRRKEYPRSGRTWTSHINSLSAVSRTDMSQPCSINNSIRSGSVWDRNPAHSKSVSQAHCRCGCPFNCRKASRAIDPRHAHERGPKSFRAEHIIVKATSSSSTIVLSGTSRSLSLRTSSALEEYCSQQQNLKRLQIRAKAYIVDTRVKYCTLWLGLKFVCPSSLALMSISFTKYAASLSPGQIT